MYNNRNTALTTKRLVIKNFDSRKFFLSNFFFFLSSHAFLLSKRFFENVWFLHSNEVVIENHHRRLNIAASLHWWLRFQLESSKSVNKNCRWKIYVWPNQEEATETINKVIISEMKSFKPFCILFVWNKPIKWFSFTLQINQQAFLQDIKLTVTRELHEIASYWSPIQNVSQFHSNSR